jgi:filamentous hemagglutinin
VSIRGDDVGPIDQDEVQRPIYEASPKHGPSRVGRSSAAPVDGQAALDRSIQVKPTSTRRVGVDAKAGEIVVLDEHLSGRFHGHVRAWADLTSEMQSALIGAGLTDRRGKIQPR